MAGVDAVPAVGDVNFGGGGCVDGKPALGAGDFDLHDAVEFYPFFCGGDLAFSAEFEFSACHSVCVMCVWYREPSCPCPVQVMLLYLPICPSAARDQVKLGNP